MRENQNEDTNLVAAAGKKICGVGWPRDLPTELLTA
jgi:hypothetical protein